MFRTLTSNSSVLGLVGRDLLADLSVGIKTIVEGPTRFGKNLVRKAATNGHPARRGTEPLAAMAGREV